MSTLLPIKTKKGWLVLGIAGLGVFFYASFSSAFEGYANTDYTNVFYRVASDTADKWSLSPTVASGQFQMWGNRYVPNVNQKLCSVGSKIFRANEQFPATAETIYLRIFKNVSKPEISSVGDHTNEEFFVENHTSADYHTIADFTDIFSNFVSSSVDYTYLKIKSKDQSVTCVTLEAGNTYWFVFQHEANANDTYYGFSSAPQVFTNITGMARDSGDSINTWHEISTGGLWSFELRNDLTGGIIGGLSPPATPSYNFTNQDFGILGNFFRDVIVFLFVPDSANLSRFGDLFERIRSKPPIGYFTVFKDTLSTLQVASGSITLEVTAITGVVSPIKTGIAIILYVILAFWVIRRLMHLDL